jgi:hypothetical protein
MGKEASALQCIFDANIIGRRNARRSCEETTKLSDYNLPVCLRHSECCSENVPSINSRFRLEQHHVLIVVCKAKKDNACGFRNSFLYASVYSSGIKLFRISSDLVSKSQIVKALILIAPERYFFQCTDRPVRMNDRRAPDHLQRIGL